MPDPNSGTNPSRLTTGGTTGYAQTWRSAHPRAVGVLAASFLGLCGALDGLEIWRTCRGKGAAWEVAAASGYAAGFVATVLLFWFGRCGGFRRAGRLWRAGRWATGCWFCFVFIAFAVTHPRLHLHDAIGSVPRVWLAACSIASFVLPCLAAGFGVLKPLPPGKFASRNAPVEHHRVEIWHVVMPSEALDYFVAHCSCDWVGTTFDATTPGAEPNARQDAKQHSPDVKAAVIAMSV